MTRTIPALLLATVICAQRPVPVDNDLVRVVVATSAPGPKGRMHRHDKNRVMVYLDKGAQRLDFEDGSARDIRFQAGDVEWDPKGGLHTSQNVGGTTFRVVEIEMKTPAAASDVTRLREQFENEQARVVRVKIEPRGSLRGFEAARPRVLVPLSEVEIEMAGARTIRSSPGTAVFDSGALREARNKRDQAAEFVVVELK